jgi:hypothetical protein
MPGEAMRVHLRRERVGQAREIQVRRFPVEAKIIQGCQIFIGT